jgi:hypothetical protein
MTHHVHVANAAAGTLDPDCTYSRFDTVPCGPPEDGLDDLGPITVRDSAQMRALALAMTAEGGVS